MNLYYPATPHKLSRTQDSEDATNSGFNKTYEAGVGNAGESPKSIVSKNTDKTPQIRFTLMASL